MHNTSNPSTTMRISITHNTILMCLGEGLVVFRVVAAISVINLMVWGKYDDAGSDDEVRDTDESGVTSFSVGCLSFVGIAVNPVPGDILNVAVLLG